MDTDNCDTPQKPQELRQLKVCNIFSKKRRSPMPTSSNNSCGITQRKSLHPRTPNSVSNSYNMTPGVNSPPAKRFSRVRNPFEAILVERLHLPIIGSPSLFQRPATPQHSSTQFEWTIDEVSSLQPANVEAHETQFHDSPDPETEAKAQSAISLYFKEQQIVPSPIDCPLRNQRIILSEINGNTPISKSNVRKIRNNSAQTVLSLPSILPKALEEALASYFTYNDDQQTVNSPYPADVHKSPNDISFIDYEARDVSLRRKLFDMHNIIVVDNDSDGCVLHQAANTVNALSVSSGSSDQQKLSDNIDKDSFGSLSPISLSPSSGPFISSSQSFNRKSRMQSFIEISEMEDLSPIQPPRPTRHYRKSSSKNCSKQNISTSIDKDNYRSSVNSSEHTICSDIMSSNKFSPERSSSPVPCLSSAEMFVDSSFNVKVSRLAVNSSKRMSIARLDSSAHNITDNDINLHETENADEDVMQMSQTSINSNNSSSSNTPQSKRRSISRKNLSHSFSAIYNDSDAEADADERVLSSNLESDLGKTKSEVASENLLEIPTKKCPSERSVFYRTDSGFNEMTNTQDGMQFKSEEKPFTTDMDQIYMCCSTPSKDINAEVS